MNTLLAPRVRRSSISLTALIDVVFILLMFFMLTSSFTRWKAVDLLAPAKSREAAATEPQILILDENDALRMPNGGFTLSNFRDLAPVHLDALEVERAVVLIPQADVTVQSMVAALEQLKSIGLVQVSLGPTRERPSGPPAVAQ